MSAWQPIESAPRDARVLVNFAGAGPIVAYRDPQFPSMWVRYVGFGKSTNWPTVHEDFGIRSDASPAIAFNTRQDPIHGPHGQPLGAKDNDHGVLTGSAVRRLTPRECERLQDFQDDYTLIPWRKGMAPDGPRYKALGNSMAVPVMAWIGRRIAAVDALGAAEDAAA